MIALWILSALLIKHFLFDYAFQMSYMLEDKGSYLKVGGLHHSFLHGVGTLVVFLCVVDIKMALGLAIIDMLVHYHVDYIKYQIVKTYNWKPENKSFWNALGFDQLVHQFTYIGLVVLALAK